MLNFVFVFIFPKKCAIMGCHNSKFYAKDFQKMRNIKIKLITLVSLLALLAGLFSTVIFADGITTKATGYTSASDVEYSQKDGYITNWGARGEVATFLSKYAQDFYTGTYVYDKMSLVSGGSGTSDAMYSDLYEKLQTLMKSKHTHITSYNETRPLYCITDCVSNDTSTISSFYSGTTVSGTWDSGQTWNREHTWPNSKGLDGSDENDIMMLRPTAKSENFSRSNTAYGESSSYYDPGKSVHGDCARIALYVYVRWGNTGKMWGSSGVIENLDILLKWMAEDPVDTWEMARNDAVQSITGTRNVFVDYPEYAWMLFGRDVPDGISTPSSSMSSSDNDGTENEEEPTTPSNPDTGESFSASFVSSELGLTNAQNFTSAALGEVTVTAAKGGNTNGNVPKFYSSGSALRFYNGNEISFLANEGYKIKSITITAPSSSYYIKSGAYSLTNGVASGVGTADFVITPSDPTGVVTLRNLSSSQIRISKVEVVYERIAVEPVKIEGLAYNLTLHFSFDVHLYIPAGEAYKVSDEFLKRTEYVVKSDTPYYMMTKKVNANAVEDDISFVIEMADGATTEIKLNIVTYSKTVMDGNYTSYAKRLMYSMLNYVKEVYTYENKSCAEVSEILSSEKYSSYKTQDSEDYGTLGNVSEIKGCITGATLVLGSSPSFQFSVSDSFTGSISIKIGVQEWTCTYSNVGTGRKIVVDNLLVNRINEMIEITVTPTANTAKHGTYSLASYINGIKDSEKGYACAVALYNYGVVAKEYSNSLK